MGLLAMLERYKHSGVVPPLGLLAASVGSLVAAVVLGVAYAWASQAIYTAHVVFVLTLGFGAANGAVVAGLTHWAHIRAFALPIIFGILSTSVSYYVYWCASLYLLSGAEVLTADPRAITDFAAFLHENGSWSLDQGAPVTGRLLVLFWLAEIVVVYGCSIGLTVWALSGHAYCEHCEQWTQRLSEQPRLVADPEDEEALDDFAHGQLEALRRLHLLRVSAPLCLRLTLRCCPSCEKTNLLTAEVVTKLSEERLSNMVETKSLLKNVYVPPQHWDLVCDPGRRR